MHSNGENKNDLLLCISCIVYQSSSEVETLLNIKTEYGTNNDTYIIHLEPSEIVDDSTLQVNLKFISTLSDTLQGFYRVSYEDSDSDTKK